LRAIELGEQLRYYAELGKWLSNLAGLYLGRNRLDKAGRYARRAVEIVETLDLSAAPWTTYGILARIATAQGCIEEAAPWRRKEQDSYAAYAGSSLDIQKWQEEIAVIVAGCQGKAEAKEAAQQIIAHYQDSQDWGNLVRAIRRILDGERDIEALRGELDRTDFVIVRTILTQILCTAPASAQSADAPSALANIRQQWAGNVAAIIAASQADAEAEAQVAPLLSQLEQQDDWRALAAALRRILAGERNADALLAGLDDTDALIIGDVLRGLGVAAESEQA
jgi:hypothetical protein